MLVVNNYRLHGLERNIQNIFDVLEAFLSSWLASRLLKIEAQILDRPFRAVLIVVLIGVLLDGHVRQMHHHVAKLVGVRGIFLITEPCEAERAQPDPHRAEAGDKYVNSQVEFFTAYKKRPVNIATDDVLLALLRVERQLAAVGPLLDLPQLVDEEDAGALRPRGRFHNPGGSRVLFELLLEYHIVVWKAIGHRHDVQIDLVAVLVTLSDRIVLLLHVLSEALEILDHQVLAGQLKMVGEVVQQLHIVHSKATVRIEYVLDGPRQSPVDVPLLVVLLWHPAALLEVLCDARLVEVCLPLEFSQ